MMCPLCPKPDVCGFDGGLCVLVGLEIKSYFSPHVFFFLILSPKKLSALEPSYLFPKPNCMTVTYSV